MRFARWLHASLAVFGFAGAIYAAYWTMDGRLPALARLGWGIVTCATVFLMFSSLDRLRSYLQPRTWGRPPGRRGPRR